MSYANPIAGSRGVGAGFATVDLSRRNEPAAREALPRYCPPDRDHGRLAHARHRLPLGPRTELPRPSRPIRSRKPTRWPTPSRAAISTTSRTNSATCCCRSSFHARMAEEQGAFDFGDVVETITAKLIRRHPHVFADADGQTAKAVEGLWERIKSEEKAERGEAGANRRAGRGAGRPARVDPRAEAAEQGRPGRLRLERSPRGARQDPRGSRRDRSRTRSLGEGRSGGRGRRSSVRGGQPRPPSRRRSGRRAARRPTSNSSAVSGQSNARWPRAEKRRKEASFAEMDALWDAAKAEEKAREA